MDKKPNIQRVGVKLGLRYISVGGGEYLDVKSQHATFYITPGVTDSGQRHSIQ
jgi:hypothetical protein